MSQRVYILDTSFLIWLTEQMSDQTVRDTLQMLAELVEAGRVTFPRQVRTELDRGQDDELTEWIKRVWRKARSYDVDQSLAREVTQRIEAVIDKEKPGECADPWIVAQAIQLRQIARDVEPVVVTNDVRARGDKQSLVWACQQEGVEAQRPAEFVMLLPDLHREIEDRLITQERLFDVDNNRRDG